MGLYWGSIGVILRQYCGNIGVMLGLYWGYTRVILGVRVLGFCGESSKACSQRRFVSQTPQGMADAWLNRGNCGILVFSGSKGLVGSTFVLPGGVGTRLLQS